MVPCRVGHPVGPIGIDHGTTLARPVTGWSPLGRGDAASLD
jgi:hypothetical protein